MPAPLYGDYSWLFDLVAWDEVVRRRALDRHQALVAAAIEALHRWNVLWARERSAAPTRPQLVAELDQAGAARFWYQRQTISGPVGAFLGADPGDPVTEALWSPFAVLFLRWEAQHPTEWGAPGSLMWSRWGTKESLLRRLERGGLPDGTGPQIAELVLAALQRPYQCKDWMYARLVRHLDPSFPDRVAALASADDPLVRLRARFVLHAAGDPERRITRGAWQRWLSADH
ncbi:hypothetical protein MRQ36_08460 [Micromonospora sp. R77]|uniref:hypothetical protein n=1 Tax=Micromonospora sp. R77 TaxID=2925836 RepID=UPI001F60917D|nr:hypothetical protein [Micromonospora sp. R77]MCI4062596.1 hypothetical protein [Micromonospora sp. R77]